LIHSEEIENLARKRILVVGLDGAPYELFSSWIGEYKLPTFAKIAEKGVFGNLTSTIPPCTAAAWSSFLTGKNPGKHGVYEIIARKPGGYGITPVNASYRRGRDILDILSNHRKKVVALNVPFTYPPKKVNGFMVTGMITPPGANNFTYPSSLKRELEKKLGYRVHNSITYREGGEIEFLQDLYEVTERRFEATIYLMRRCDWDLFMVVFNGTDQIQHALWKYMNGDGHAKKYRDAIFTFYEKMDKIMKELLDFVDKKTTVIVLSDHGASTLRKWIHINNFLMDLGLLKLNDGLLTRIKYFIFKLGITPLSMYRLLLKLGYGDIRKKVRREKILRFTQLFLSLSDVNWSETKAFAIPGMGQIYINVKGREPRGVVNRGKEYAVLRDFLIEKLNELEDPETGEKVIEKVFKKEEIFHGPYLDQAPDLQYLPKIPFMTAPEHEFGSNSLLSPVFGISSRHTINGILLLRGPDIKSGVTIDNAEIIDLAPTILYIMGLPVPSDMDGKVLTDALVPSRLESEGIVYEASSSEERRRVEYPFSAEEEEEIKKRLRALGYLAG
jgi:predicted AlkP superfamily phosphohydrolase/phosphomutase